MPETQATISQWAEETFGTAGSDLRVAARANEEMSELIRCLAIDPQHPKAAEEAADAAIVLSRFAERRGYQPRYEAGEWLRGNVIEAATYANQQLATILKTFSYSDRRNLFGTVQDVLFALGDVCECLGTTLQAEIDRKMAVNRAREWKRDGTGHGYHVKAALPAPAPVAGEGAKP